ncbi:MAG: hypothetical protein AAFV33_04485 [Chloroflexota bacterium]
MANMAHVDNPETRIDVRNMRGSLPRRVGAISGLAGSLGIMVVVTILVVATGNDLFTAPLVIASVLYGEPITGFVPVLVGTGVHLLTGTVLGFIFAAVMPGIHRTMWMVAGLIYGMGAFVVSSLIVLPLINPVVMTDQTNAFVFLLAHVIYGFILGIVGSTHGIWWDLPKPLQKDAE